MYQAWRDEKYVQTLVGISEDGGPPGEAVWKDIKMLF
jgi:hypothetical protein